jgi:serine phosphatase RsbU (regulator of sigma subunit)
MLMLLNRFLYQDLTNAGFFLSLFYLQYDSEMQQIRYANAGHPPPLVTNALKSDCAHLDADGLLLGVQEQVVFEEKSIHLSVGDLILFYTDGLTEAENAHGEFFGLERVRDIVRQSADQAPQAIIDALMQQLKQFRQNEKLVDDVTLMVFKRVS